MITPQSTDATGLCLTCNNSPACYYHARRGPVLFCELFDDYVARAQSGGGNPSPVRADPSATKGPEDCASYAGLCMNCEHRRACVHPKAEGGVWHCEDYE